MRINNNSKYLLGIILGIIINNNALTGELSKNDFSINITVTPKNISPYEPVTVYCAIKNKSNTQQEFKNISATTVIEICKDTDSKWHTYRPASVVNKYQPSTPIITRIEPNEIFEWEELIAVDNDGNKHEFDLPGTYKIRIKSLAGISGVEEVVVSQPQNNDSSAYLYVKENKLYCFFTMLNANLYHENNSDKSEDVLLSKLSSITQKYPDSRYSQWAKLGQLFVKMSFAGYDGDNPNYFNRNSLERIHEEMDHLALSLPEPINAHDLLWAGLISLRLGNYKTADIEFEKAYKIGNNKYYHRKASDFKYRFIPHETKGNNESKKRIIEIKTQLE